MDYASAGVHIDLGDAASKLLFDAAKQTFVHRKGNIGEIILPFDDFSGVRAIDVGKLPQGSLMSMGFDGVGTKVEIAQRMEKHDTIAFDLLAMVCDDAVIRGAEPVVVGSVLDVNTLQKEGRVHLPFVEQLARGYVRAAQEANVAIINGELAELGNAVGGFGSFGYNWCASVLWFANKEQLFTGREVQVGDSIVALQEKGFRSNGLSLVRKVFKNQFGEDWHRQELEGEALGKLVLHPSTIYSRFLVHLHGGFQTPGTCIIHGAAHITGGGIPGKLGRILQPKGVGAVLNNLLSPGKAMQYCQQIGKISDEEAYKTWNMGQGMLVITPEPEKVLAEARQFGITAQVAGEVVKEQQITLISKGVEKTGEQIIFAP